MTETTEMALLETVREEMTETIVAIEMARAQETSTETARAAEEALTEMVRAAEDQARAA